MSRGGSRKGRQGNWNRPEAGAVIPALAASRGRRKDKAPIGDIADRRSLEWHIREFVEWYCSEPRLAFNKTVVTRYRIFLEQRHHASTTINLRLAAIRRLAYQILGC